MTVSSSPSTTTSPASSTLLFRALRSSSSRCSSSSLFSDSTTSASLCVFSCAETLDFAAFSRGSSSCPASSRRVPFSASSSWFPFSDLGASSFGSGERDLVLSRISSPSSPSSCRHFLLKSARSSRSLSIWISTSSLCRLIVSSSSGRSFQGS